MTEKPTSLDAAAASAQSTDDLIGKVAAHLTGRQYLNEVTYEEEAWLKTWGLVVVFGASDDLCQLRGAILDEVGCNNYQATV
jgi:hypothetical protein